MDIVGVCYSSTGGCACRRQALNQGCRPHMNINTRKLKIHPQLCCSSQVQMHAGGKVARDAGPVIDLTAKVWQSQTPHTTHHEEDVCWSSHVHTHAGSKVTRDAGPVKGGTSTIAFVEDPTGYKWEIIGSKTGDAIREPIAQAGPVSLLQIPTFQLCISSLVAASGQHLGKGAEGAEPLTCPGQLHAVLLPNSQAGEAC